MANTSKAKRKKSHRQLLMALCDRCQGTVEEIIEKRDGNALHVTVNCHGETLLATIHLDDLPAAKQIDLIFFTPEQERAGLH